ncbi:hypothetical protein MRB53_041839 [Persea americana]|nr:hypothetical protein MRB53_041839 [Persea americana]
MVRDARKKGLKAPVLLMGYFNPIYAYGGERDHCGCEGCWNQWVHPCRPAARGGRAVSRALRESWPLLCALIAPSNQRSEDEGHCARLRTPSFTSCQR